MPRPSTKAELLTAANGQFEKLRNLIVTLSSPQEVSFEFDDPKLKEAHWRRDKNLRDVYIHLHEWHKLLLDWVESNTGGTNKSFLPEPYNWKTYGDMNVEFWKKHQNTSYETAEQKLLKSHGEVIILIDRFSDEELFTKKHFSWTGTSSLGSYCVSATSSHYDWAIKKIRQYLKDMK